MDRNEYQAKYEEWKKNAVELSAELSKMTDAEIEDAFYRDLEFGTGGLRGVIGAGTNRMNVYTVAKASQGLANYVNVTFPAVKKIAVAYDSRIKSDVFSRVAAGVFAAHGLEVFLYPELMPTPALSFAVRYYGCSAGVVVTASHNPSKYNGYKVYGPDGCQITTEGAAAVLSEIERLDVFSDVLRGDFDKLVSEGKIKFIGEDCVTAFLEAVKSQSVL
ncbi:MAG: phospho-sugar mutase, partial [Clostridia bacterium]|nr:phospho-sugar mutase [Clostridia bacterium]